MINMQDIYDLTRAAKSTGIDRQVLKLHIAEGVLRAHRLSGGQFLIDGEDLAKFTLEYHAGKFDGRRRENKKQ